MKLLVSWLINNIKGDKIKAVSKNPKGRFLLLLNQFPFPPNTDIRSGSDTLWTKDSSLTTGRTSHPLRPFQKLPIMVYGLDPWKKLRTEAWKWRHIFERGIVIQLYHISMTPTCKLGKIFSTFDFSNQWEDGKIYCWNNKISKDSVIIFITCPWNPKTSRDWETIGLYFIQLKKKYISNPWLYYRRLKWTGMWWWKGLNLRTSWQGKVWYQQCPEEGAPE